MATEHYILEGWLVGSMSSCLKSLKEINDLIFKFIWDNKGDKIKRTEMIADYQEGGLKILDIMEFNKALKITWILKGLGCWTHTHPKILGAV